ncbi:MAG: DUF11 domain-containing protein [Ardenticatenaceae bacterium]|nr:DUF11 domain-containing protein [Ardenticatenaceae bacterium]
MTANMPLLITETVKLVADNPTGGDLFGYAVDLDGDTLIVGAPQDDDGGVDAGAVYIYERHLGGVNHWGLVAKLMAGDSSSGQRFGSYVDVEADTLVVGANENGLEGSPIPTAGPGSVYIFYRNQGGTGNWGEVRKLTADDGANGDNFGVTVAINGDTVIVGAQLDNHSGLTNAGAAYVFERDWGGADNWGQVAKLVAADAGGIDRFGIDVRVEGDIVAVGSVWDTHSSVSYAGSIYLYERNEGGMNNWGQIKKITASDPGNTDNFGHSIVFQDNVLITGAHRNNDVATNSGSVYVFARDEGGANNWGQVTKFLASDAMSNGVFGRAVNLADNILVIGARFTDSTVSDSGAAYFYIGNTNDPQDWQEVGKLVASDASTGDEFGFEVAVGGGTAVVGAPLHDAGGNDAGAVYIYDSVMSMELAKAVVPEVAEPGDVITYSVQLNNHGYLTASGVILTDLIPTGITNVSYVNSGVMITPTGNVSFTWQVADIPPGGGGIITITGRVDSSLNSEGVITNTAVLTASNPTFGPLTAEAVLEVNIPPTLDIIRFYEINEGQSITLTGIITDPGLLDSFVLQVDWGDGLTETINYPPGTSNFQQPHPYADDDPSVTPVDEYPINLILFDSDGSFSQQTAYATVHNVTPTVAIGPDMSVLLGQPITFTGTFTDPGLPDTFTLVWHLGDGTIISDTLTPVHLYAQSGTYTVTLAVTDDDNGTGQDQMLVTVRLPQSDVSINKDAIPSQVMPGDALTYTIAFHNQGPDAAVDVYITDTLPLTFTNLSYSSSGAVLTEVGSTPYSWHIEELAVGQGGFITITGQLAAGVGQEYLLWNTAVITSTNRDITPTNNSATVAVDINLAPTLAVATPYIVFEGENFALTGDLADAGDVTDLQVMWGDGTTATAVYPPGSFPFTLTHTYADDNPSGTATDGYTVTLHLTDSDGASTETTALVTVHNVPPDVQAGASHSQSQVNSPITFNGQFSDPGIEDTFAILWDFGDGVMVADTLTPTHRYLQPGTYTATLTITDDDGGVGQANLTLQIEPNAIFLPLVAYDACHSSSTLADVLLVIDTSASMSLPTQAGGQTKLEAAQTAAAAFLNILPFPANQAGIVSFNTLAVLDATLTGDQQELLDALAVLAAEGTTRIDLALALSRGELSGPRHIASHEAIILLLTDGVPNGTEVSTILAEANAAKAAGITIYTIGLGADVDGDLLQQVASSPAQFYLAPTTADLDTIYQQIANIIRCDN